MRLLIFVSDGVVQDVLTDTGPAEPIEVLVRDFDDQSIDPVIYSPKTLVNDPATVAEAFMEADNGR